MSLKDNIAEALRVVATTKKEVPELTVIQRYEAYCKALVAYEAYLAKADNTGQTPYVGICMGFEAAMPEIPIYTSSVSRVYDLYDHILGMNPYEATALLHTIAMLPFPEIMEQVESSGAAFDQTYWFPEELREPRLLMLNNAIESCQFKLNNKK